MCSIDQVQWGFSTPSLVQIGPLSGRDTTTTRETNSQNSRTCLSDAGGHADAALLRDHRRLRVHGRGRGAAGAYRKRFGRRGGLLRARGRTRLWHGRGGLGRHVRRGHRAERLRPERGQAPREARHGRGFEFPRARGRRHVPRQRAPGHEPTAPARRYSFGESENR